MDTFRWQTSVGEHDHSVRRYLAMRVHFGALDTFTDMLTPTYYVPSFAAPGVNE
jgi:hypothetical protein